jgi:hypothetical protein
VTYQAKNSHPTGRDKINQSTKWKIVQGCKEKYGANYILKFIAKRLTFLGSASLPREIRAYFTGAEPKEKNVCVCPCESVANP